MRKHLFKLASLLSVALALAFFAPQRAAADEDDPPSRVARLAYAHGTVSFNPAGTDDWVNAVVNRPITTGDKVWNDEGARSELSIGSSIFRLGSTTGFSFLNLSDNMTQVRITEGTLQIRVRSLGEDETFEVDTPNLAFSILRPGNYKINVNEGGDGTVVIVRDGEGEVTGGGSAYTIHPREIGTFNGTDQLDADVERWHPDDDDFDGWCSDRDRRIEHSASARYVSTDAVGYEDLDDYGGWRPVPEYGTVWFPHVTVVGWAPYRYGHWAWIAPWGWTWVDDAPWGFAPFHYGRWVVVGGVWGWVPCPPRPVVAVAYVRPVYAPALVAWVGGPHFSVGIGIGGGGGVGVAWFPLGPRDVYCPSYHVSQRYVTNVNVTNTTIINQTNVTNVYNNVYVNKTTNVTNITYQNQNAAGAVTATSHQAFTGAQPVGRNMVKVDAREVASAPVAPMTPAVAPQQHSVLGAGSAVSAKPPAAAFNRQVVAKIAPPPPPTNFAQQQQAIQANGGRPVAMSQMRQMQPAAAQAHPNVKIAAPASPAAAQNVKTSSGQQPAMNPNANNGQNQAVNPNRPPSANNPPASMQPAKGNASVNNPTQHANQNSYADRPPTSRASNAYTPNPQLDQKHQEELQKLRDQQDHERQKLEQQQQQERTKAAADEAKQQQTNQKHQEQLDRLEQKHDQEQQKLQQKQTQERQKQDRPKDKPSNNKPPKEDKPHK